MSADLKIDLLNRITLVDELIVQCISNISSLTEKLDLEHIQLGKLRDQRQKLDKHVSSLNEIQEMLGSPPAGIAPSPSADVPPPSSVGGGEPITIEVNHANSIGFFEALASPSKEKEMFPPDNHIQWLPRPNSDVEASVPSGSPSKEVIAEASVERLGANTGGQNVDPHNGENHTSRRKRVEQVPQNKNLGHSDKRTAAEKISASLAENAEQTAEELAEKFSVTVNHVRIVCRTHGLDYKKKPNGRPSVVSREIEKALLETPELGNHTIAKKVGCSPKLVREVRKKTCAPKSPNPVGRPKSFSSTTSLITRPSSIVREKPQPFFEPSKRKLKILNRIVERETGKHLHQDLLGMKSEPVFVDGVSFAWQGTDCQLEGCAKLMKFDVERLKSNDPSYPYFSQKFEA